MTSEYPPRICRSCVKKGLPSWHPHEDFEREGRGKDRGRILVSPDCKACRKARVDEMLARLKARRERIAAGEVTQDPKPRTRKAPAPFLGRPYKYLGTLPPILHWAVKMGFFLGRAVSAKGMRRKMAWKSYYMYREKLLASLTAAKKRASQDSTERETKAPSEEAAEWERMEVEVAELVRSLGQG